MTDCNNEKTCHRIVISGISGRFPKSNNVSEFQNNLLNKEDCTVEDHGRWHLDSTNVPPRLGKMNNIQKLDRFFFGIHAKLVSNMDPLSRFVLEHSFEAVMDAGINPRTLKGKNIAVVNSSSLSESEKSVFSSKVQQTGFGIIGSSRAMAPNRISFFLGLTGPSYNIESEGSGNALALQHAYTIIKEGYCDSAIVTSCTLCLLPEISYLLKSQGILSPDGVTRCFDDNVNGHTRSDAVVAFFLQRASDAKRIYHEVVNVRALHMPSTQKENLLLPTLDSQINLMRKVLDETGLTPDDIAYVEAGGVGIKENEAEELQAIEEVYCKNRKIPLPVGSVKSIVGNTFASNASVSIIKMIIGSETGKIAANLHYKTPNSKAPALKNGKICISTDLTPWNGQYCAVNITSTVGIFASIILKTFNKEKKNNGVPDDDIPRLIISSGRTEEAVATILNYVESRPVDDEFLQMLYDIFQVDVDGYLFRGYTIVPAKGLTASDSKKQEILFNSGQKREVWWVFSGMGSQWVGMGEALLKIPVFEAAIRKCDTTLRPQGYDIYKIITEKDPQMFDQIIHSFIGIAAIQVGLVDVLRAVGLTPDYIIGHSVGELGCAYADGCFTAEQMILAALSRGLASTECNLEKGSMAAVGLGYEDIKPLCPLDIDIACHNGPGSSTVSGPAESMKAFVANLSAKGIFAREVASSNIAYHSRYIAPAGPKLLERLQKVIPDPSPRSSKWVSTSIPREDWNTLKARLCSAEYHTNNLLSPVLFEETSRLIPFHAICVEIAPHGLLQAILKRSLSDTCVHAPLTRRDHPDNSEVLLTALGKLYNAGLMPQISNLYPKIEYPVSRGTPSISSLIKWDHSADHQVYFYQPPKEVKEGEKTFEINLNENDNKYLQGNVINGNVVIPLSLCLMKVWEISKSFDIEPIPDVIFEDIKIYKLLNMVPDNNIIMLTVTVSKGTRKFEVLESGILMVSGLVKPTKAANVERLDIYIPKNIEEEKYEASKEDFYREMEMRGFHYTGDFKSVLKSSIEGTSALIKWNKNWLTFIDAALQLYAFGNDMREVEVPFLIRKIIIDEKQQNAATQTSKGIKTILNKNLNYLSGGGLEFQGVELTTLTKACQKNRFSNDTLQVIANIDKSNLSLAACLRIILQLILENTFSTKIQKINLIEDNDAQTNKQFTTMMHDVPEVSLFKIEAVSYKDATFNKILTIITNNFKHYDVNKIAQNLGNGKFLLTFINNVQDESCIKSTESAGLKVVFLRKSSNESIVLFRKKRMYNRLHIINVSNDTKETINKITNTKFSSENERIVAIIKSKDKINTTEFLEQIEKTVNLERVRIFDIQDPNVSDNPFTDEAYKNQLELDLLINILTPKRVWATLRRTTVTLNPRSSKNWSANQRYSHNPTDITWTEGPIIENNENVVKVEYSALNPEDVLIANGSFHTDSTQLTGKNRLEQISIGLEFSGRDLKGNRIMGITCGNSMSNFINVTTGLTWAIPNSWSFEDAATVPLSYVIAYTCLFLKADVKGGEEIILWNSCDGVGLAILHLAIQKKCDIFVIYVSENEKKWIQTMFPKIQENRLFKLSDDNFLDDVLLKTNGQGVDVVISNQCEVKKLEVFLTLTKKNARVVYISDLTDDYFHQSIGMYVFLKGVCLISVVPKKLLTFDSTTKKILVNMLQDGINTGNVKPLPRTTYYRELINEAFQACLAKNNLGKILVKVQPEKSSTNEAPVIPRLWCLKNKSYLIIEGLSTFGLELIDWLITRGARRIIIASSLKNDNDGFKNLRLKLWLSYGVQIILRFELDFSQQQNITILYKEAASLGPIDAVFDLRRIANAMSKSNSSNDLTTENLDDESRYWCPELRLFIVCSATTTNVESLLSNKKFAQLNSINNSQDQIVKEILDKRRKAGLHAVLIRWGFIDFTRQDNNAEDTEIILPPVSKYLEKLDEILGVEELIVNILYITTSLTKMVEEDPTEIEETDLTINEHIAFKEFLKNDVTWEDVLASEI